MNLREIFALQPLDSTYDFSRAERANEYIYTSEGTLSAFSAALSAQDFPYEVIEEITSEQRIQTRTYMNEGDDKYGALLYGVFFDEQPIMLVKNNGRYYSDYEVYTTNPQVFAQYESYIMSKVSVNTAPEFSDMDADIPNLQFVGNYDLMQFYDAHLVPQYGVGDVVWAWVPENHLKYTFSDDYKGDVLTRVRIERVNAYRPVETYWGVQLDRFWGDNYTMRFGGTSSGLGATFNDAKIVGKVSEMEKPEHAVDNYVDENGYLRSDYVQPVVVNIA